MPSSSGVYVLTLAVSEVHELTMEDNPIVAPAPSSAEPFKKSLLSIIYYYLLIFQSHNVLFYKK
jgi:hypothetical protein